ncbi:MAG: S-methyl-5-thioribose-1-phosphate isomerase [Candidatus Cloacimonadales bacterium]
MKVNGKDYRTIWLEAGQVYLIEQNLLPFQFEIFCSTDYRETCRAIKEMLVRGAGAIGSAGGFALAQAFLAAPQVDWLRYIQKAKSEIEQTRPTAQNLFYATNRVYEQALASKDPAAAAVEAAQAIADEDVAACQKIGELGNQLLPDNCRIETHCNAGWLAFTDFGSALAPIYTAHKNKKNIFVYVDETRPRSQGARLTAWELANENIPHAIIADNAAAHLMQHNKIDLIIVGADRIAANGDVANKIGTLEKAICAKNFGIPFYVAAPASTIDFACASGRDIPIEERSAEEIFFQTGIDIQGQLHKVQVCSPGSPAVNPAFDVTPAKFITAIITEKGIFTPAEIAKLKNK